MTFVSLVLIQFFKAYNFRSDHLGAAEALCQQVAEPRDRLGAALLLALVIYAPFLQKPFGTVALSPVDWLIAATLAFTVSPALELAKWMERRGWFGPLDGQTTRRGP